MNDNKDRKLLSSGEDKVIEYYISNVGDAAKRSRGVLIILIITSVLSFMSFWNSRDGNWTNGSNSSIDNALTWIHFDDDDGNLDGAHFYLIEVERFGFLPEISEKREIEQNNPFPFFRNKVIPIPRNIRIKVLKHYYPRVEVLLKDGNSISQIVQALTYVSIRGGTSSEVLETKRINKTKAHRESTSWIGVPFFGVNMYINDLGLFSGFTFSIILLWLLYSFKVELRNLKYTFNEGSRHGVLERCYNLLSMRQVLTTPRQYLNEDKKSATLLRFLPKGLIILPLITYFLVVKNDWYSIHHGLAESYSNTVIVTIMSIFFLGVIVLLTFLCLSSWSGIDKEWNSRTIELRGGEGLSPAPIHIE